MKKTKAKLKVPLGSRTSLIRHKSNVSIFTMYFNGKILFILFRLHASSHIDGKYHPFHMRNNELGITAAVDRLYNRHFKLIHMFGLVYFILIMNRL